jgi:hypothetical protein
MKDLIEYLTDQISIRKKYIDEDMKDLPSAIAILTIEVDMLERVLNFVSRKENNAPVAPEPDFSL